MTTSVRVYPTATLAARNLAERIVSISETAMTARGHFIIALSGGNTPRMTYELLAGEWAQQIDWSATYVFWSDERCVPPEHPDSNAHMARLALLNHIPIPTSHVYRLRAELPPEAAADEYEKTLHNFFSSRGGQPRFDLVLLGMGADGHTASLFPHTAALHEKERWVAANWIADKSAWRLTLTASAINAARQVIMLVTGEDKADAVHAVIEGERQPDALPAQLVAPQDGNLLWLLDEAAARKLAVSQRAALKTQEIPRLMRE